MVASAQATRIEQARKLYEAGKSEDAAKALKAIRESDSDYAAARYWLGRIAFDDEKFDDAAEYFEEATEANDKVALYYQWLGDTYGSIAQDANVIRQGILAPKMKKAWERAISLDANNTNARRSLIEYYMQAPAVMGGSGEKAIEVAQQIKKINVAEGHLALGNIYLRQEKPAEAEREFIAMATADPEKKSSLAQFYTSQKKYDQAFAILEDLAKAAPTNMVVIYQIGRASALSGQRLERGEECLKKYLAYTPKRYEPSHAGAYMRLGQIMEKKGNKGEAKKYYQLAVAKDQSLTEAKEGLQRVSK
jgi:tetratricopeptide (TPR) repeat protein